MSIRQNILYFMFTVYIIQFYTYNFIKNGIQKVMYIFQIKPNYNFIKRD